MNIEDKLGGILGGAIVAILGITLLASGYAIVGDIFSKSGKMRRAAEAEYIKKKMYETDKKLNGYFDEKILRFLNSYNGRKH